MIAEILQYPFFQRALVVALLVSVMCGIIGTFVVVKQMASISGGLAHAAFGGVGLAFWLGLSPIGGAFGFCILSSAIIAFVYRRQRQTLDTVIAIVWSVGMALGAIFIALTPGYTPSIEGYLFGSILLVPKGFVFLVAALDVVVVTVVALFFKELQAVSFDEEFSEVAGINVDAIYLMLLVLCSIAVVALIYVVGAILTIALLTTPAVIARQWRVTLKEMMFFSCIVAAAASVSGLFLSLGISERFSLELPTGPLIILVVTALYALSSLARRFS